MGDGPAKGVAFAAPGSMWMNWWSSVTSANRSIRSWVTANHSPGADSLPISS